MLFMGMSLSNACLKRSWVFWLVIASHERFENALLTCLVRMNFSLLKDEDHERKIICHILPKQVWIFRSWLEELINDQTVLHDWNEILTEQFAWWRESTRKLQKSLCWWRWFLKNFSYNNEKISFDRCFIDEWTSNVHSAFRWWCGSQL